MSEKQYNIHLVQNEDGTDINMIWSGPYNINVAHAFVDEWNRAEIKYHSNRIFAVKEKL